MKVVVLLCVLVGTLASSPEGTFFQGSWCFRRIILQPDLLLVSQAFYESLLFYMLPWLFFSYSRFPKLSFLWFLHCITLCSFLYYFPVELRITWCTGFERQEYKHSENIRKYEVVTRRRMIHLSPIFIPRKPGCEPGRGGVGWGRYRCGRGEPRLG